MDRRSFLALTGRSSQYLICAAVLGSSGGAARTSALHRAPPAPWAEEARDRSVLAAIGRLAAPDANGIRLPEGFSSRLVAASGRAPVADSRYLWHGAPDGGAVFATDDGGWIYVSNSELDDGRGGVGALRFDAEGLLADAYPILEGTSRNCAGGATPWNTWLSCEEIGHGQVFECDPLGREPAVARPALGRFTHEAAAVDPETGQVYMTEDLPDGRFYRFTPDGRGADGRPDLGSGTLEVARIEDGHVLWMAVPDPSARRGPTRQQVPESTAFDGGEGMVHHDGRIYFTTKGDHRVWCYDIVPTRLYLVYDRAAAVNPVLSGGDNVTVNAAGDLLVAEDGGDMQIVVVTPRGLAAPLLQVTGHLFSEVTGPAFTPDHRRLYFSSQRGQSVFSSAGLTYEITGPFPGAS